MTKATSPLAINKTNKYGTFVISSVSVYPDLADNSESSISVKLWWLSTQTMLFHWPLTHY